MAALLPGQLLAGTQQLAQFLDLLVWGFQCQGQNAPQTPLSFFAPRESWASYGLKGPTGPDGPRQNREYDTRRSPLRLAVIVRSSRYILGRNHDARTAPEAPGRAAGTV